MSEYATILVNISNLTCGDCEPLVLADTCDWGNASGALALPDVDDGTVSTEDLFSVVNIHPMVDMILISFGLLICSWYITCTSRKPVANLPPTLRRNLFVTILSTPAFINTCQVLVMCFIPTAPLFDLTIALQINQIIPAFVKWLDLLRFAAKKLIEAREGGTTDAQKDEGNDLAESTAVVEATDPTSDDAPDDHAEFMHGDHGDGISMICKALAKKERGCGLVGINQATVVPLACTYASSFRAMLFPDSFKWLDSLLTMISVASYLLALFSIILTFKGFDVIVPGLYPQFVAIGLVLWALSFLPLCVYIGIFIVENNAITDDLPLYGNFDNPHDVARFYSGFWSNVAMTYALWKMTFAFTSETMADSLKYAKGELTREDYEQRLEEANNNDENNEPDVEK